MEDDNQRIMCMNDDDGSNCSRNLNEDQQKALKMAISSEENSIVLIQGPPGTGKTFTLAEVICEFMIRKEKIFVLTPSNYARFNIINAVGKSVNEKKLQVSETALIHKESMEIFIRCHPDYKAINNLAKARDELDIASEEFEELQKEIIIRKNLIKRQILSDALVVFSTVTSSFVQTCQKAMFNTNIAIIDEAGQLAEVHQWSNMKNITRLILAGDPQQLPAFSRINEAKEAKLNESLMERLLREHNWDKFIMLTTQYREIPNVKAKSIIGDPRFSPLVLCDTDGEVHLVLTHLETLLQYGVLPEHIGIITPYIAQDIVIDTVDAFQGKEREIILFSMVRKNPLAILGFLNEIKRLNVAVTRAKRQFIMFGSSWMLSKSKKKEIIKLLE
ncbi:unnamed protein product [Caenorhabditis bovis]|uniref:AAA+ ATPase domain-containing protein n=1 Tax=Caenorhabditis bovis TaxID=2654633 RepID=A0A8S1ERR5_9PELO|nr:unnamed protein product [Caenorhabditis bovis]